jgi:hypothetical protein
MRSTLAHMLILILLSSGLAAVADPLSDVESFHGHSSHDNESTLFSMAGHDDTEHHAHHGCHMAAHMVALVSETPSFKPAANSCTPINQSPNIITRRSAPPTRPPRT